jgi:cobaltochelatase CobN
MGGFDVAHLIQEIDGYLCELGAAEIRDGLHILGQAPHGAQLVDTLCSMTRLANQKVPSLSSAIAKYFGFSLDSLLADKGARIKPTGKHPSIIANKLLVTNSDLLETIDIVAHRLFLELEDKDYNSAYIDATVESVMKSALSSSSGAFVVINTDYSEIRTVLTFACNNLVPNLEKTGNEIDNLIAGLSGCHIPAGPSGAPSRGMAHILPTGRNFYSVDPRSLPSHSAWQVGRQLCEESLRRHLKETGRYPESVSISVWGTSAMRTHGDDIAQILALLGARPTWQAGTRRVQGVELIASAELKRPRIDVTTRISGFFRDAFPHLIALIDQAVELAVSADEPLELNYVRKHYLAEMEKMQYQGVDKSVADRKCKYRIFGSKPGSYGAGILPLIQERNWSTTDDFAEAYLNWGGFAYTKDEIGTEAKEEFKERLTTVEIALHNQDNREHDIFDSDDYLQFHGGMIATIKSLSGRRPKHYFGDSHDPSRASVRDLKEEVLRVFRSRVVNPKWLESIQRHGYKGGLELAATVDYLFGYDATADLVDDWMYEAVAEEYALNPGMQDFLQENNPWALNAISERLLEAAKRNMWASPKAATINALSETYLRSETTLEEKGERKRQAQGAL